jgi:mannose-6-phosphate isomerase-like protein (cupin superfamily)
MEDVRIFRSNEIDPLPLIGSKGTEEGWMKRVIYPQNVATKGVFFGVAEVNPGHSPHRWHNHVADKAEGYEVVYPENFEEIYYIVSGTGVVQWSTEDEKIKEEKVTAGDVVFFPAGVAKHQLLNNGTEKIVMVFCGTPTAKVTLKR